MDGNLPSTNAEPPTLDQLITSLKQEDAATRLPAIRQAVSTPANGEWLGGRIKTLLSHFYRPDMDPRVERKIAEDWISTLKKFPQFALEAAVSEYLETGTHRPAPGHIAKLAKKHLDRVKALVDDAARPQLVDSPSLPEPSPEESEVARQERRRRADEIMNKFRRPSHGWGSV